MESRKYLPIGWEWKTLGDVCRPPQYGWTTSATSNGKVRLLRTTDITSGVIIWEKVPFCSDEPPDIHKYLLKDGDIVISRAGSVGYSILVKNPLSSVFASYLIRFRPKINEKYISYFLQSPDYWQSISEKRLGIAIPNVNATKLKQIPIPVPPLPEQERIVERIESLFTQLDAGVAGLKRLKEALKRYKASVLKAACEGRLVNGKSIIGNGELPDDWRWGTVGDVAESMKNGIYKPAEFYADNGIACLRMYNIEDGIIVWKDIKRMILTEEEIETYRLLPGDILVNRVNSRELVGKAAVIPRVIETYCIRK